MFISSNIALLNLVPSGCLGLQLPWGRVKMSKSHLSSQHLEGSRLGNTAPTILARSSCSSPNTPQAGSQDQTLASTGGLVETDQKPGFTSVSAVRGGHTHEGGQGTEGTLPCTTVQGRRVVGKLLPTILLLSATRPDLTQGAELHQAQASQSRRSSFWRRARLC